MRKLTSRKRRFGLNEIEDEIENFGRKSRSKHVCEIGRVIAGGSASSSQAPSI